MSTGRRRCGGESGQVILLVLGGLTFLLLGAAITVSFPDAARSRRSASA